MSMILDNPLNLTYKVSLAGGQRRLREAILYVCKKNETAQFFGLVKLNKIIWLADFTSFAERGQPVTGRMYQKLEHGPAPVEMLPLLSEMQRKGEISLEASRVVQFDERRPKALVEPILRDFSPADIEQIDRAIEVFWNMTAKDVSDRSHGVAWRTRANGDPMPYELAYLSDEKLGKSMRAKLASLGKERAWRSK